MISLDELQLLEKMISNVFKKRIKFLKSEDLSAATKKAFADGIPPCPERH
jgi:hypothetical protein